MKRYIAIMLIIFIPTVSFADAFSAEAGGQGLVYEHGGLAGFYLGPEAVVSYSFETELSGGRVSFLNAVGIRASFLFDSFSSGNPASNVLPVYFTIGHGLLLDDTVEVYLNSGIGFISYIDPALTPYTAFSFSAGAEVRTVLFEGFYIYYSNRWSASLPYGVFNNNWIFSAGAGYTFDVK